MLHTAWQQRCGSGLSSLSWGSESGGLFLAKSCVGSWLSSCRRSWPRSLGCSCLERSHISSSSWLSAPGKGRRAPRPSSPALLEIAPSQQCDRPDPPVRLRSPGDVGKRARRGGKPSPMSLPRHRAGHRVDSALVLLGREVTLRRGWSRKATTNLFWKPGEGSSVAGWDPAACVSAQPRPASHCPSSLGTAGAIFHDAKGHTVCDTEDGCEDQAPADEDGEKVPLQPLRAGGALRRGAGVGELIEGAGGVTGRAVVGRSALARVAGGVAAGTDAGCVPGGGGSLGTAVVARRAVGQAGALVGIQRAAALCGGTVA